MLSRIFSCIQTSNNIKTGLTNNVRNIANIRATSYPSKATFSNIRNSNPTQNRRLPGNLHAISSTIHKQSIFGVFFDTCSSLLFGSQKKSEKIENAIKIRESGEEVFLDECHIKARSDGPIELYTTGLVYCTGILMTGKEKVGMAHIHGQGFEFMQNMFDAIQPNQLIIYASNGVSEDSFSMEFYVEMIRNLNFLRTYAKQVGVNCEITNLEYSTQMTSHCPGLFYSNKGEKDWFCALKSKEMKKLNQKEIFFKEMFFKEMLFTMKSKEMKKPNQIM